MCLTVALLAAIVVGLAAFGQGEIALADPVSGGAPSVSADGAPQPKRVVVKVAGSAAASDLRRSGFDDARPIGHDGTYVLEIGEEPGLDVAETVDRVRRMPGVIWARQTVPRAACLVPDDPLYASGLGIGQWSLSRIRMPVAWDLETGSGDVIMAILDTGIDQYRPDFAGRIVSPYSAVERSSVWPSWRDKMGHGTAVAGVAVAQGDDAQGMAGVAWNVKIMPVKIADDSGLSDDALLADGLYWAVDHGADVINISFAGPQVTTLEANAIRYAVERGVIVVAAAGNKSSPSVYYPAALPGVIAVGATTRMPADSRASFSAVGENLDLTAPGTEILSWSVAASSWVLWQGTSFSAPMVAGVAALVCSAESGLTGPQVGEILNRTADDIGVPGWDREFGWGVVDARAALTEADELAQGTTSSSTTSTSTTTTSTTVSTSTTSTTSTTVAPSTTTTTVPQTARFVDVTSESSPYFEQIERLAGLGVITGKGDGLFHPREAVLRQQFAKMIVKTLGYPVDFSDLCPFGDMAAPDPSVGDLFPYHYVAVAWARGITNGTDETHFSPYRSLTRAQLITMVVRAAALGEPSRDYVTPFGNFSAVHYPYARRAAYAGLLDTLVGMGAGYDFFAPASREEVCALLFELLGG